MALIHCPSCGKEISDKAMKCPQCNTILKEESTEKIVCTECGEELQENDTVCPKCGCPVPTKADLDLEAKKKKKKKFIFVAIGAIVALFLLILSVNAYKITQEKMAQEKALKESQEYAIACQDVVVQMFTGGAKAEKAANLIHDVWYDTIYDEYNEDTSKYVSDHSDFNDSINALFNDSDFSREIDSIKANQDLVAETMKQLINPPADKQEAYSALKKLYDSYLALTRLATSPTGTLQSYTSDFNEADTDFIKNYEATMIYFN